MAGDHVPRNESGFEGFISPLIKSERISARLWTCVYAGTGVVLPVFVKRTTLLLIIQRCLRRLQRTIGEQLFVNLGPWPLLIVFLV